MIVFIFAANLPSVNTNFGYCFCLDAFIFISDALPVFLSQFPLGPNHKTYGNMLSKVVDVTLASDINGLLAP